MAKKFNLKIECEKVDEKTMYLKQALASGECRGKKFDVTTVLPTGGLLLRIEDNEKTEARYLVPIQSLVQALLNFHFDGGGSELEVEKRV